MDQLDIDFVLGDDLANPRARFPIDQGRVESAQRQFVHHLVLAVLHHVTNLN